MNFIKVLFALLFVSVSATASSAAKKVTIGTTPGDFAILVKECVRPQLEALGYTVRLVEFTDYVTPNLSLADGRIDLNIFQHRPYLDQFAKAKKLRLKALAPVPTAPLGLYAGKLKSLSEVKAKSSIAIPNDPTNLARALYILKDLKWIGVSTTADPLTLGVKDITKNLKNLKILPLEAAQVPRAAQDVDYAVINGNYAISSGIALTSALAQEKSDLYINWAVIAEDNSKSQFAHDVTTILNSEQTKTYSKNKFKGYRFPESWGL